MKFLEGPLATYLTSLWQAGILFGFGLSKLATVPNPLNPRVKKQEFNGLGTIRSNERNNFLI